ncbi:MAG TPA: GntR family transcriptional regulator [Clostridiaceae bacterium]|nr:GntR family transcriptional regulator [Clostridiaceae bacterium]
MSEKVATPLYLKIALDIASRIARGEFKENTKIYGRSIMSSEYGVSPETIRRSLKLLSDMNVVEVKQSSGAVVLSRKNAQEYINRFKGRENAKTLHQQLKNLVEKQSKLSKEITHVSNMITRFSVKWSHSNPLKNFEVEVGKGSPVVGKSINELNFWHATGATIVAIRRNNEIILSPGPYAVLAENDTIIFIGDQAAVNAVTMFVNP